VARGNAARVLGGSPVVDWSRFDPRAYLDEYYRDLGAENLALLRFHAEVFRELPRGAVLLDFGGGPTLYPVISAAPRVSEIHFTDYLEANLAEVRRWLAAEPGAFDWNGFIRAALEIERGEPGAPADVERRAALIRSRVTHLARCDASRTPPLDYSHLPYDVVLSNFCAESATADHAQWQSFVFNIASLLRPGGWLVLSALKGATHYSVGASCFPAVDIAEDDLAELLEECGFPRKQLELRSVPADRPTRDYQGLILALAQKGSRCGPGRR
jgi:hypothetical protein